MYLDISIRQERGSARSDLAFTAKLKFTDLDNSHRHMTNDDYANQFGPYAGGYRRRKKQKHNSTSVRSVWAQKQIAKVAQTIVWHRIVWHYTG